MPMEPIEEIDPWNSGLPLEPTEKPDPWEHGLLKNIECTILQARNKNVATSKDTDSISTSNLSPFDQYTETPCQPSKLTRSRTLKSPTSISSLKHYQVTTWDEREQQRSMVREALEHSEKCSKLLIELLENLDEDNY